MTTLRSVHEVATVVEAARVPGSRLLVGIAGEPGAGKSTLAEQLVERLGPVAALLPMDGFHLPQARLIGLGRRNRMGAPDTFDVDGLVAILGAVRHSTGRVAVRVPGFDREREEPVPDALSIAPDAECVVIEGNYLLLDSGGWQRVAPLLDRSFFVELDEETRIARLIARHERFGKTAPEARAWALGPDQANAEVIRATAARADYRIALG